MNQPLKQIVDENDKPLRELDAFIQAEPHVTYSLRYIYDNYYKS